MSVYSPDTDASGGAADADAHRLSIPAVDYAQMRKGARWAKAFRARIDKADDDARALARRVKRDAEKSAEMAKLALLAAPQVALAARVARDLERARLEKAEAERRAASEPIKTGPEAAAERQRRLLRNQLAGCVIPR
jgi:hypothetical protein